MELPSIFFIIGPNGVGKSTILPFLKLKLGENFKIYDFDERGVPNNADKIWRRSETKHWFDLGEENKKTGKNTVICGFAKPEEIEEISQELAERPCGILLDADADTISERIRSRYLTEKSVVELLRMTGKTVDKFVMDNVYYSNFLRESCVEHGYEIVETSGKTPENIASEVLAIIKV